MTCTVAMRPKPCRNASMCYKAATLDAIVECVEHLSHDSIPSLVDLKEVEAGPRRLESELKAGAKVLVDTD
jgi:hypothetical protein